MFLTLVSAFGSSAVVLPSFFTTVSSVVVLTFGASVFTSVFDFTFGSISTFGSTSTFDATPSATSSAVFGATFSVFLRVCLPPFPIMPPANESPVFIAKFLPTLNTSLSTYSLPVDSSEYVGFLKVL